MIMYDMAIVNLPWSDLSLPPAAPALLKGIAETHGYSVVTKDFNIDFKKKFCNNDKTKFEEYQDYFLSSKTVRHEHFNQVDQFYDYVVDEIANIPARYIGISVFSVWTHKSTLELCSKIRTKHPSIKLVVGGKGLTTLPHLSIWNLITTAEKMLNYHQILIKKRLVDVTLLGDTEDAIIDLLSGTDDHFKDWNQPRSVQLEYPFSNFDDYDFDQYIGLANKIQLPVISSKGCVRSCDFCDVSAQFARFQSKHGGRLAEEIIYLSKKYKIYEFACTDSIMNGNMKSLRQALEYLADYNDSVPNEEKVKFAGNWICRMPGNIKPEFFDLMARAGIIHLTVGAEHGSDRVLEIMKKKTTVAGLYYELEQLERVGIQCVLNNITGHWAENYNDFLIHLDMILKNGPLYANRTIDAVMLGGGYSVLKNTPSDLERDSNGLVTTQDNFSFLWYTEKNPNLTLKTRLARWYILYRTALSLKIPLAAAYSFALTMKNRLKESFDSSVEFYQHHVNTETYETCSSIDMMDHWNQYVSDRIEKLFPTTQLILDVEAFACNGNPHMVIQHNDSILFDQTLSEGRHRLEFDMTYDYAQDFITFEMTNKGINDTLVDDNGNIISDKCIRFHALIIDKIDLFKDLHYYYNDTTMINNNGDSITTTPGFYGNNKLIIGFQAPFWRHFMNKRFDNPRAWEANSDMEKINTIVDEIKDFVNKYEY